MRRIGEICGGLGGRLLTSIRVVATINGVPSVPIVGGKSKSGVGRGIFGRHLGVLELLEHGAKMSRNGESLGTRGKGLLVGIRVIATITVVPSGPISGGKSRFGIGKAIFWCRVGLLGSLLQGSKIRRMSKKSGGWSRGLLAGIWLIAAVKVVSISISGGSKSKSVV